MVPGLILIGGKLFSEFILLFTTAQYKNAKSANFVYLPKNTILSNLLADLRG